MERLNLWNLKDLRRRSGRSAEEVAKMIGKSRSVIWKYENGFTDISIKTLIKLLEIYNASIFDVFDLEEWRSRNC